MINSKWVQQEVSTGLMRRLSENSVKLFPVLKDNCKIPPILQGIKYANFKDNYDSGFLDLIQGLDMDVASYLARKNIET